MTTREWIPAVLDEEDTVTPEIPEWLESLTMAAVRHKRAAEAYRRAVEERAVATYRASVSGAPVAEMATVLEMDRHNVHRLIRKGQTLAGNASPLRPATGNEEK